MMQYMFLHGLGQDASAWNTTMSYVKADTNYICPDLFSLPNHGRADYSALYHGIEECCESVSGKINLCGLSLGAILAINYAVDHPEKVQSLALAGAQFKMPVMLLKLQNAVFRLMPEKSFAGMGLSKADIIGLTKSMMNLDFSGRLKDISCPVAVICGERDKANQKAARELAETIPGASLHLIKGAGHEVNRDTPKELAAVLNGFYLKMMESEGAGCGGKGTW